MLRTLAILGCLVILGCASPKYLDTADPQWILVQLGDSEAKKIGSGTLNTITGKIVTAQHVAINFSAVTVLFPSQTLCRAHTAIISRNKSTPDVALLQLAENCTFPDKPLWQIRPLSTVDLQRAGTLHSHAIAGDKFAIRLVHKWPLIGYEPIEEYELKGCACHALFETNGDHEMKYGSGGVVVIDDAIVAIFVAYGVTIKNEMATTRLYAIPIEDALEYLEHTPSSSAPL